MEVLCQKKEREKQKENGKKTNPEPDMIKITPLGLSLMISIRINFYSVVLFIVIHNKIK